MSFGDYFISLVVMAGAFVAFAYGIPMLACFLG